MKKIHIVGLAVAAVLAVSAFTSSSAMALKWANCTKTAPVLSFKNSVCNENGPPNEWGWEEPAAAVAVDSEGTLDLEDMGTKVKVECTGTDEGTVGPGAADEESKVTATSCSIVNSGGVCTSLVGVAVALNLPWTTTLLEPVAGEIRDDISNAAKNPGWLVECNTLLGKVDDRCEGETNTLMSNNANGTVDALFDANSPAALCSTNGGEGLVEGLITILATNGNGIRIQ